MDWYSLRVISGKEKVAEGNIYLEAKEQGIENDIESVFIPSEKVVRMKNNKKVIKEKMFFPGYILIKMNMNVNSKYIIENTPGVLSFIGAKNGGFPAKLRDEEIKRVIGEVERKEGQEMVESIFKKNDHVKVISGPFVDFSGVVEEVNNDKKKIKVKVSIFGRPTPIELDFFQVEMLK